MTIKSFLKYVEIQTKAASQFPLIFSLLYAWYHFGSIDWTAFALFWGSLLLFDMATTAINNYMDYHKSDDEEYRKKVNIIGSAGIGTGKALTAILILLTGAAVLGLLLVYFTGSLVLILGAVSFFTGIFYTFGPIPFSRMPLGEILSGFFMGFVIVFLGVYIHQPDLAVITLSQGELTLTVDLVEILYIALVSLPFVLTISNLMLANNICDLEQDLQHDRFLLPYYLGMKNALGLFRWSYTLMYPAIIAAVLLRILPWTVLLIMPLFIYHYRLGKEFTRVHIKNQTFVLAVKGLQWISLPLILLTGAGILLEKLFP